MNSLSPTSDPAIDRLRGAFARYSAVLALAEAACDAREYATAAALAQFAARFAHPANAGLFGSPRLERLLVRLGQQLPPGTGEPHRPGLSARRQVLHVLSYARPIGGDSRYAWRWIQEDRESCHSVVLTTQNDVRDVYEIPQVLQDAVAASGGRLHVLRAPTTAHLEQAAELRAIVQGKNVVALHLFPYDIVPVLALASGCNGAKVALVNHSDHTFWLGSSVAHTIVHLRRQSDAFLTERRCLRANDSVLLPIPLTPKPPMLSREEAKRSLGLAPDQVLLLTIATPFKYASPGMVGFLDLVMPVLRQHPQAVLMAVGPRPEGAWQAAAAELPGRVIAFGTRWDTESLYAAADVYLDSIPFASITSLLEAGSSGVPLLGYERSSSDLSLMGAGAPGLEEVMEFASGPDDYQRRLGHLLTDRAHRLASGAKAQERILALHAGQGWGQAVQEVYRTLEQSDGPDCLTGAADIFAWSPLNAALNRLYTRSASWDRVMIGKYVGALPYGVRFSTTRKLHRAGFGLAWLNLLPPPVERAIRIGGRWVKRWWKRPGRLP